MTLKIVTWNVNSLRTRLAHVLQWMQTYRPDILLLQETKVSEHLFPYQPFEDLGYNLLVVGEKSYNGVAIASRFPIEDPTLVLPGYASDSHARYVEAVTGQIRVASIYVPNGQEVGSEKFIYKLEFLSHLKNHLQQIFNYEEPVFLGGDYNIAPVDRDIYDPKKYANKILASPTERHAFRKLLYLGYVDVLNVVAHEQGTPAESLYTWWDYRQGSWEQNHGLRIDHFLASPQGADRVKDCYVDPAPRGWPKPSDHAPLVCEVE